MHDRGTKDQLLQWSLFKLKCSQPSYVKFIVQIKPLGTWHALKRCWSWLLSMSQGNKGTKLVFMHLSMLTYMRIHRQKFITCSSCRNLGSNQFTSLTDTVFRDLAALKTLWVTYVVFAARVLSDIAYKLHTVFNTVFFNAFCHAHVYIWGWLADIICPCTRRLQRGNPLKNKVCHLWWLDGGYSCCLACVRLYCLIFTLDTHTLVHEWSQPYINETADSVFASHHILISLVVSPQDSK